jgi:hypothetical protein
LGDTIHKALAAYGSPEAPRDDYDALVDIIESEARKRGLSRDKMARDGRLYHDTGDSYDAFEGLIRKGFIEFWYDTRRKIIKSIDIGARESEPDLDSSQPKATATLTIGGISLSREKDIAPEIEVSGTAYVRSNREFPADPKYATLYIDGVFHSVFTGCEEKSPMERTVGEWRTYDRVDGLHELEVEYHDSSGNIIARDKGWVQVCNSPP